MKVGTLVDVRLARVAMMALMIAPAASHGAPPAGAVKSAQVRLENVPGSSVKRVILTEKAAQRLGIEAGKVSEQPIIGKQMVGGLVVAPSQIKPPRAQPAGFAGFAPPPSTVPALQPIASQGAWVLVMLSPAEWERLAKDSPARLLPLLSSAGPAKELLAQPSGRPPVEDPRRSMLTLYYVVPGVDHGLEPNKRMRVELQIMGRDEKRKVVPYSAVYYDTSGTAWVYLNPGPLVFVRQRVGVERIAGDFAVLSDGPPLGTTVVTVGAPLLYGAEIAKK